jgi:acyl-CoA synthetase (NDP forming)
MTAEPTPLHRLFSPRSIALVGVSRDPGNLGHRYLRHLLKHGFPPESLSIVNRNSGEINGIPVTTSIAGLDHVPDVAIVLTGGSVTLDLLGQLAQHGVPSANIFSDSHEVVDGDARIKSILASSGMRLLGPNSPGFVRSDPPVAANASAFLGRADTLRYAPVSIISQSGAIAGIIGDKLLAAGAGFDLIACTGNEVDITAGTVLAHLLQQPSAPHAVGLFLETLRDADPLVELLPAAASLGVQVFVLKAGRTESGRRAGFAHSGGIDNWGEAAERQVTSSGAVMCHDVDELATSLMVACLPRPAGVRMATCCTSGGLSGVFADLVEDAGFELADLPTPSNPWDTGAEVIHHPERVAVRFRELLALPDVDCGLLAISTMPDSVITELFKQLAADRSEKPYLVIPVASIDPQAPSLLAGRGGVVVSNPVVALGALALCARREARLEDVG